MYSASYAAVPHIVHALAGSDPLEQWSTLQLVVCIEIARLQGRGPDIPSSLEGPYFAALERLPGLLVPRERRELSELSIRAGAAALAVAHGHGELAEAILELEPAVLPRFMEWVTTL